MSNPNILKTSISLIFIGAVLAVFYWTATAFQSPLFSRPKSEDARLVKRASPPAHIPTQIAKILEQAERARIADPNNTLPYFQFLRQAQEEYRKLGKEREALLLYVRMAYLHGLQEVEDETTVDALLDSVTALMVDYSVKYSDPELMIAKNLMRWNHHSYRSNLDSALYYINLLEKAENTDEYWDYLYTASAGMCTYFDINDPKIEVFAEQAAIILNKHRADIPPAAVRHFTHLMDIERYGMHMALQDKFAAEGDYEKSLEEGLNAVASLHDLLVPDSLWISTVYFQIANTYSTKGDFEKTQEYYKKALMFVAQRFPHAFSDYNRTIGDAYLEQGNAFVALPYLLAADRYNEKVDNSEDIKSYRFLKAWTALVHAYTDLNNPKEALFYLQKIDSLQVKLDFTAKVAKDYGDFIPREILFAKAHYYHSQKDYTQAEKYYKQINNVYIDAMYAWAKMELERGNAAQAADICQSAIDLYYTSEKLVDKLQNPKLESIKHKHEALLFLSQKMLALRQCLAADSTNVLDHKAYKQSIRELSELGVNLLEQVCNSFEREGSTKKLIETSYLLYESAIQINYELYQEDPKATYLETAFQMAERSKSMLLMGAMREENALRFAGIPDSLLEKEHQFLNNIAFYEQALQDAQFAHASDKEKLYQAYLIDARTGLDALKARFNKDFPQYFQMKYNQTFASPQQIQQRLAANDLFVEFFEGKDAVYVFSINADKGLQVKALASNNGYAQRLTDMQYNLTHFDWIKENLEYSQRQIAEHGHWLFREFLGHCWSPDTKRMVMVADGRLSYLPFEVLLTAPANQQQGFTKLPYLLKSTALSYQYSATLWLQTPANKTQSQATMLAMAASYPPLGEAPKEESLTLSRLGDLRSALTPIEGAVREVESLQSQWQGSFYYGDDANEAMFKEQAPQFQVIHLAMHGLVDARQPEQSSLAFTNKKTTEDNFLQVREIKRLPLKADLVVLSACETGYGKYQHGEGVVSIGRGFMYAGVSSLLMSLWSVNDASTAFIMERFYQQLNQGNNKSEALRLAKIQYLEQSNGVSSHPAYWMPFVVLGEDASMQLAPRSGTLWYWMGGGALLLLGALFFIKKRG